MLYIFAKAVITENISKGSPETCRKRPGGKPDTPENNGGADSIYK